MYAPVLSRLTHPPMFVGGGGFGAAVAAPCASTSVRNAADGECYCDVGFDWNADSTACIPIDISKPCAFTGEVRSPVDKKCECPPGMHVDYTPAGTNCIPYMWFPNCKDAKGNAVPNCFMGRPLNDTLIAAGIGAVLGAGAALLIRRFL